MDAKTPMPRLAPHPHQHGRSPQACAVLSVGTPTLIAAALRAGRRGADPSELTALRASLATLAHGDPAAALVVVWLDAKLGLAVVTVADPRSLSPAKESGENVGDPICAGGTLADGHDSIAPMREVRS